MFYHVLIETTEKDKQGKYEELCELDKTDLNEIEEKIVKPYIREQKFRFNGYNLISKNIRRLIIKSTRISSDNYRESQQAEARRNNFFMIFTNEGIVHSKEANDLTNEIVERVEKSLLEKKSEIDSKPECALDKEKVFIVHGHDEGSKQAAARFVERIGLEAIILHEKANSGKTIIEKIEKYSNVGFGIILYTPCDIGGESEQNLNPRARQNVVFEHGFLIGKIGRENVCALVKDDVETPGDISGVVYIPMDSGEGWKLKLAKEIMNSGYDIDLKKI